MNISKNISKKNKINFLSLIFFFPFIIVLNRYYMTFGKNFFIVMGFLLVYLLLGLEIFKKASPLNKTSSKNETFLILLSSFLGFILGSFTQACLILLIYNLGEIFKDILKQSIKNGIKNIINILPATSKRLNKDQSYDEIDVGRIKVGDILLASDGEKIAVDGKVIEGEALLDTSSLTGNTMPKVIKKGSAILASSVLSSGHIKYEAESLYKNSIASKLINLVENSIYSKSYKEEIIEKLSKISTSFSVALASIFALVLPILGFDLGENLLKASSILILSCPFLYIGFTSAYLGGLGLCLKNKIIVKNKEYLDKLIYSDIFFTEKTSTLTDGDFYIDSIKYYTNYSKNLVLDYLYNLEKLSNNPKAMAIVKNLNRNDNPSYFIASKKVNDINIWAKTYENKQIKVGFFDFVNIDKENDDGSIYMSIDDLLVCKISLKERLKDGAKDTFEKIRDDFSQISIISKDNVNEIIDIAKNLGISYYSSMNLNERIKLIRKKQAKGHTIIYMGDSLNNSSILEEADIGISLGEAFLEKSLDTSDILLMSKDVAKIKDLFNIADLISKSIRRNFIFALVFKLVILILTILGVFQMLFVISASILAMVITSLWTLRILNIKF